MKYVVMSVFLFFMSSFAFANDMEGLSETQKAEIALQVAKMKENSSTGKAEATVDKVVKANDAALDISKKWAGVGKELAVGITETAKQLGVAANDFAVTPLGKVATGLIIWNYMGKDILATLVSFILLFIGLPVCWHVYRKVVVTKIIYEEYRGIFNIPMCRVKQVDTVRGETFFFTTCAFLIASASTTLLALRHFFA